MNICVKKCTHYNADDCIAKFLVNWNHPRQRVNLDRVDDGIDINIIVVSLPVDILTKIYNEYFKPIKYYQLFKTVTENHLYTNVTLHNINRNIFISHFHIFIMDPIEKYISRMDHEFKMVLDKVRGRGYTSTFRNIPNIVPSVYVEILMYKYH